jgi:hypothetical protein
MVKHAKSLKGNIVRAQELLSDVYNGRIVLPDFRFSEKLYMGAGGCKVTSYFRSGRLFYWHPINIGFP